MRVTANTNLIRRRGRLGMTVSLIGIGVLGVGMVVSLTTQNQPQLVWVPLAALILGFLMAQYGSYNLRRWGRSPRPDQLLEEGLKGFDDRYHFYVWSLPAPYVLLTPNGVYTFVTRDQTGAVSVKGATWQTRFSLRRLLLLFAQEGLGNPTEEARTQASHLQDWIRSRLPEVAVVVQPAIVFIDPRVQLEVTDPVVPVLEPKGLKKWLRGAGKGDLLKPADFKALEALFDQTAATARQK